MTIDREEKKLQELGFEEVKWYGLINNDGYTFKKNDIKYDLRHWVNCFGAEVNFWSLSGWVDGSRENVKLDKSSFDTFDEALNFIKTI